MLKETPRNLIMSALFNGRKGSRPPAGNPTSIACHGLMDIVGVNFPEAHLLPGPMAELALAGHEVLGFDVVMPEFSVTQEAAALGCTMDWGDRDHMPNAKDTPYADFSDVIIPDNILEKPSLAVVLDAISTLRHHVGDNVAIFGKVMGPWTISYHLAGTENFLLQIGMKEEKKVLKMLRQVMRVTIDFANAQIKAGADAVCLADHATGSLVGPYAYKDLLLPIHQEITAQIGGPIILHVCGNCSDRLELFAESGVDAYHFEWQVDAIKAVKQIGNKISLVGNINNSETLWRGTPLDVYKQARYAIEAQVNIIAPECAIPLSTPVENLKAIVAACRDGY
jgi:MtaA/CmuA family methyltransferase